MVRQIDEDDYGQWRRLWDGYLHFYRGEVSEEATAETFARLCERRDGLAGFVAEDGEGKLCGFAHIIFHPSTWTSGLYCYLEDLYVERPARGTGMAGDLIRAVYDEADAAGVERVYWETQEFNSPARSLYDTLAHRTSFIVYER
ncbi:MAG: GNAT family N-acetyltransferase [Acidimicrobiales bacterium]